MRVLVVEDEEALARSIVEGLETKGFAADYVTDGEAGLNRISLYRNEYDAVVLDLMLPGMRGEEICQLTRKADIHIPILILTARDDVGDTVSLLNMGADDYLAKPFSFDELVARLNALMRRPGTSEQVTLSTGDVTLNTATRTVKKSGKEIPLTLKEFSVLEYLMRNPNRVVSRDEIVDHVWDFHFPAFSNIVDVHVKNVRKKIGNHDKSVIETVRGVGYRLEGQVSE